MDGGKLQVVAWIGKSTKLRFKLCMRLAFHAGEANRGLLRNILFLLFRLSRKAVELGAVKMSKRYSGKRWRIRLETSIYVPNTRFIYAVYRACQYWWPSRKDCKTWRKVKPKNLFLTDDLVTNSFRILQPRYAFLTCSKYIVGSTTFHLKERSTRV